MPTMQRTGVLWHDRYGFVVLHELWQHEDGTWYGVFGIDYMGMTANLPMPEVSITFI